MSGLYANTESMDSNGKEVVESAREFHNEIDNLNKNVQGLLGMWTGPSATEFSNAFEAQKANLERFQQLLNDLGEGVSKSARILNDTEEENAMSAKNLFKNDDEVRL